MKYLKLFEDAGSPQYEVRWNENDRHWEVYFPTMGVEEQIIIISDTCNENDELGKKLAESVKKWIAGKTSGKEMSNTELVKLHNLLEVKLEKWRNFWNENY